jgi:hypothetical protein
LLGDEGVVDILGNRLAVDGGEGLALFGSETGAETMAPATSRAARRESLSMYLSLGGGNNEKLYFAGYFGADAERMNFPAHQITGSIIDQAVAGNGTFAGKCLGNNL